jgi:hypothetical protein
MQESGAKNSGSKIDNSGNRDGNQELTRAEEGSKVVDAVDAHTPERARSPGGCARGACPVAGKGEPVSGLLGYSAVRSQQVWPLCVAAVLLSAGQVLAGRHTVAADSERHVGGAPLTGRLLGAPPL